MSAAPQHTVFSHGNSSEESKRAHDALAESSDWRLFSFRGVMIDPIRRAVFLQLGCPGCDSTVSKATDFATAMDAITNLSGVCHRSLEMLNGAVVGFGIATHECVPSHVPASADQVTKIAFGGSR